MLKRISIACVVLAMVGSTALADWDESMPHKMHYPQLPDPDGWDIDMTNYVLADDWKCSETGLVDDIHFWYSVEQQMDPTPPPHITAVQVSIHDDLPAGDPANPADYSMPGNLLRQWTFDPGQFVTAGPWDGLQGWDDPQSSAAGVVCRPDDHRLYWQINITKISDMVTDPFRQQEGTIYWLDLHVDAEGPLVGWKTTREDLQFNDFAVYATPNGPAPWAPIRVCTEDRLTDLAFVITPEPCTLLILGGGLAGAVLARRKR